MEARKIWSEITNDSRKLAAILVKKICLPPLGTKARFCFEIIASVEMRLHHLYFITTMRSDNPSPMSFRKVEIDGLKIFFREAGIPNSETILFLHGFPSSSHMYRHVMSALADEFHVLAPDYPGFGYSESPSTEEFEYTFDNITSVIEKFIKSRGLTEITLFMQDYGGPIGFRIMENNPSLVKRLVIQNANTFLEGLGPVVQRIGALTEARDFVGLDTAVEHMMSLEGIKEQYLAGATKSSRISPDAYFMDHFFMELPGRKAIQKVLFGNYGVNFLKYPQWQAHLRQYQPNTFIAWGGNDNIFPREGALAYRQVLPDAEVHIFEGSHFMLEEFTTELLPLLRVFLRKEI